MSERKLPHIGLAVGSVSPDALVCGDPERATRMARHLQDVVLLGERRAYRTYRGLFDNLPVTICSHGIGAPGAAIAFEELIAAGARRIIRVGTCGGLQPDVQTGDLIVATAAVQNTGYGRAAVPEGYPAAADLDLTLALREAAAGSGRSCHTGLVVTCDNFYDGAPTPFAPDYQALSAANVLATEMECAALFIIGSLRGAQTAAILAVDGNVLDSGEDMDTYDPDKPEVRAAVDAAAIAALTALRRAANQ